MLNKITKEDLVQFNKDAEIAINTFTNRMKELYEGIAAGVEGNTVSIEEYTKELNQELKKSIIIPEEEMKDYLPEEVKE